MVSTVNLYAQISKTRPLVGKWLSFTWKRVIWHDNKELIQSLLSRSTTRLNHCFLMLLLFSEVHFQEEFGKEMTGIWLSRWNIRQAEYRLKKLYHCSKKDNFFSKWVIVSWMEYRNRGQFYTWSHSCTKHCQGNETLSPFCLFHSQGEKFCYSGSQLGFR